MTVHILDVSKRGSFGPSTLDNIAVEYVIDGEPGVFIDSLREFLEQHADDVVVPDIP